MSINETTGSPRDVAKYYQCGAQAFAKNAAALTSAASGLAGNALSHLDNIDDKHKITPDVSQMTRDEYVAYKTDIDSSSGAARNFGLIGTLYSFIRWFVLFTTGKGDSMVAEAPATPENGETVAAPSIDEEG